MLKKIILATATLAASMSVATANAAPYIGISTGVINNTSNVKALGSEFTGGAYRGIPLNVFAGYGNVMNDCLYFAAELFGTIGTANISDNTQLKSTYGYGASIIPGVMLSDRTLAYVRAGVVRTRFSENDESQNGGQLGFGMQTSLTQHVDLRGEYDFVAYEAKNFNLGTTTVSSVAPRSDQFNVGLVYKFE